jgi:hypothetical protein
MLRRLRIRRSTARDPGEGKPAQLTVAEAVGRPLPLTVVTGAPGTAANVLLQAIAAQLEDPVVFLTGPGDRRVPAPQAGLSLFNGGGGDAAAAFAAAVAAGPRATLVAELPVLEEYTPDDERRRRDNEHLDALVTWARGMRSRDQRLVVRASRPPVELLALAPAARLCVFTNFAMPVEGEWRAIAPGLPAEDDLGLQTCAVLDYPGGQLAGTLTMDRR